MIDVAEFREYVDRARAAYGHHNATATALLTLEKALNEIEQLRAGLKRIDYYYDLNDCDEMKLHDAIEIDVKALREIHNLLSANGQTVRPKA